MTRIVSPKQIVFYADEDGNEPFEAWIDNLRDKQGRRSIINRLFRVQQGNYGDVKRTAKSVILRTLKPIGRSIKAVRKLRTLDEFAEGYFRDHPDEIDDYLTEIFQDYAEDNDTGALLASLRVIARVRGVSDMAQSTGMSRQGIQKALSGDGNPRLGNVTSIMKAMGYCLVPQKLPSMHTPH